LHIGGGKSTQFTNIGRLITAEIIEDIEKWRKELKGDRFLINLDRICEHTLV
jgi:hypothetical protein